MRAPSLTIGVFKRPPRAERDEKQPLAPSRASAWKQVLAVNLTVALGRKQYCASNLSSVPEIAHLGMPMSTVRLMRHAIKCMFAQRHVRTTNASLECITLPMDTCSVECSFAYERESGCFFFAALPLLGGSSAASHSCKSSRPRWKL